MSARVEVVAVEPCPVCEGTGSYTSEEYVTQHGQVIAPATLPCTVCNGTGEVRRVVTCAGCRWWEATAADGSAGLCGNTVVVGVTTAATWGCGDWEATEGTR